MKEYIFVLGREPDLSFLEVISYFKARGMNYKILDFESEIAVFLLEEFDPEVLIRRLGGIVKIAEVFEEYEYKGEKERLSWGISVYKGNGSQLKKELIKEFKKEKVRAMFRTSKEGAFNPSEIIAKNLLEFIVYKKYKARTVGLFDPRWYKERDETRPKQILLHQVSLRLARILINLSYARENVLDPFCGVGTILQEAMMSGINVYGLDIDRESAEASKTNLEWLKNKYNLKANFEITEGDAKKLTRYYKRNLIQSIATEPYLGPYYKKMPSGQEVEKEIKHLEKLYYEFLIQARQIMKKNGKIAIVIPRLKSTGGRKEIDFESILRQTGFKVFKADKRIELPIVSKGKFLDRLIYVLEAE